MGSKGMESIVILSISLLFISTLISAQRIPLRPPTPPAPVVCLSTPPPPVITPTPPPKASPPTPPSKPSPLPPTPPPKVGPTKPPSTPPKTPPSSPPSIPPTSPPKAPPTRPPSTPPKTPPSSPPSVPPTTPPKTPPSSPPSVPPTSPPKTPPTTPPNCDIGKLSVCVDLLDIFKVVIGGPRSTPCCRFINGLVGLDASVCICAAIRANVLGVIVNQNATLKLLLNQCGHVQSTDFICS